jgi:HSP20 family molecular chaperone IbpA
MHKRHICHICTLSMLLGTNVYAGDDIAQEKATPTQQENNQDATPELSPHASLKQMSTFFDEFDNLFEQHMHEFNQQMVALKHKMQIASHHKQEPRFAITESPSQDNSSVVIKVHLPGFTREEVQVKFVTTQDQDAPTRKMLEIAAEHKTVEPATHTKQKKTAKGHQIVSESVVRTHHVFTSSSYENGRGRTVSYEDGRVKIQYDLPDNVDLAHLDAAKDSDYITLDKEILSITLPVTNE